MCKKDMFEELTGGKYMEKVFPIVLMVLDGFAGIVYLCNGDIKRGFYWLFALGLTYCVTF